MGALLVKDWLAGAAAIAVVDEAALSQVRELVTVAR